MFKKKVKFIKIFGIPYYTRYEKRLFRWKPFTNEIDAIIPFRRLPNGRFEPEWKWTKPDE